MRVNRAMFTVKALSLAAVFALAAGCATTAQINEVRAVADQAQRTAAEAQRAAESANSAASAALAEAQAAKRAADAAQRCCTDLEEKVERAFERGLRK